jgi:2-dehydro-3-deoxyphosphogluconate aldolase/(4S)-4-hydroxy-2-oxoglutarate aldolase
MAGRRYGVFNFIRSNERSSFEITNWHNKGWFMTILEQLNSYRIIPVIEIEKALDARSLGKALMDGGLPFAEITFRTDAACEAIEAIVAAFPDMWVGAGSVLTIFQAQKAILAGARYIVSPGFDEAVVDWCLERQIPVFPGIATPTEVVMGMKKGLKILKFFPSEVLGGVSAIKAISAPFPGIQFIPTGGISASNLTEYLRLPTVVACGGSWLASKKMISENRYEEIEILTREAMAIVNSLGRRK